MRSRRPLVASAWRCLPRNHQLRRSGDAGCGANGGRDEATPSVAFFAGLVEQRGRNPFNGPPRSLISLSVCLSGAHATEDSRGLHPLRTTTERFGVCIADRCITLCWLPTLNASNLSRPLIFRSAKRGNDAARPWIDNGHKKLHAE